MTGNLQALFELHAASIANALRRSGIDRDTADDLTQDTFLRLLRGAPSESPVTNLRAYLFRISRNVMLDHLRRNASNPVQTVEQGMLGKVADLSPGVERKLSDRQRLATVMAVLDELPPRNRRVFELHRLEGRTLVSIADEMGISTTRAWEIVQDAYHRIRVRLDET